MSSFPTLYSIGKSTTLQQMDRREYDDDPRGIIWMWEPPLKHHIYGMGIDPAQGRTGWNRYDRVKEDAKTDNGAIEIFRLGRNGAPDIQVAEFAAPVDPFELGDVANALGRLYSGADEDQCKSIIEVSPGPGGSTLQRMLELGYTNQFRWEYYADSVATPTKAMGWHASPRTNRDLWVKASRHLILQNVVVKSPFLVEEYADCRMDQAQGWAENRNGHDDRVRAANMAIWLLNGWSLNIERTEQTVQTAVEINWQASDMSWEEIQNSWGDAWDF
jgi:hypothetical protein